MAEQDDQDLKRFCTLAAVGRKQIAVVCLYGSVAHTAMHICSDLAQSGDGKFLNGMIRYKGGGRIDFIVMRTAQIDADKIRGRRLDAIMIWGPWSPEWGKVWELCWAVCGEVYG